MGSFWAVTNPDRPEYRLPAAVYAASKAAATMLTVQYAKAEPGITFNAVEPGFTATDFTAALGGGDRRSVVEGRGEGRRWRTGSWRTARTAQRAGQRSRWTAAR